jgi:hypothetical protein
MIAIKDIIQLQRLVAKVARRKQVVLEINLQHAGDKTKVVVNQASYHLNGDKVEILIGEASNPTEMQWLIDKLRELLRP